MVVRMNKDIRWDDYRSSIMGGLVKSLDGMGVFPHVPHASVSRMTASGPFK
jgi:hypothetical protein